MAKIEELRRDDCFKWLPDDPQKDSWLRCQTCSGLALRVRPKKNGRWRREFWFTYTWKRRSRFKLLGELGHPAWTIDQARDEVRALQRVVRQAQLHGKPNPFTEDAVRRSRGKTLAQLSTDYQRLTKKAATSKADDDSRWRKHILPFITPGGDEFGTKAVCDVTPMDLWELRKKMEDTPIAFNRVLSLLKHAFNMANKSWGFIPQDRQPWGNPAEAVDAFPENNRERLFRPHEVRALHGAMERLLSENLANAKTLVAKQRARALLFLRIAARTGLRPKELRTSTWEMVSWEGSYISLTSVKGDRKTRRGRIIGLGPGSLQDLKTLFELADGSKWVLPSRNPEKCLGKSGARKTWLMTKQLADELIAEMDVTGPVQLATDSEAIPYAWRHWVVSSGAEAGIDYQDMQDFVGHSNSDITSRYRHTQAARFVEVATKIEEHLASVMAARQP